MQQSARYIVDVMASFEVDADTPDTALRAVIPIMPAAKNVSYKIRSLEETALPKTDQDADPYAHLTKATYTVDEVAEILGIGRSIVYERVPCIRVGRRRLYPKLTVMNVLRDGLKEDDPPIEPVRNRWRERTIRQPRVIKEPPPRTRQASNEDGPISIKSAAKKLGLSYAKTKELLETRKIYSVKEFGKRFIPAGAIECFLEGKTPLPFIDVLVERAREAGLFANDPEDLEKAASDLRREWSS